MKVNMKFRLLSLLLVVALLVGILPVPTVYAEEAVPGEELMEQNEAEETPEGEISYVVSGEVSDLREESVKHFRMEDGSFIAVDYGAPVHYTDGAGDNAPWFDIDNTLLLGEDEVAAVSVLGTTEPNSALRYTAVNGSQSKSFAANLSSGFLFSVERGDAGIEMFLMDDLSGSADLYSDSDGLQNNGRASASDSLPETQEYSSEETDAIDVTEISSDLDTASSLEPIAMYDRTVAAQITYPDRCSTPDNSGVYAGVMSALSSTDDEGDTSNEDLAALAQHITPQYLRADVLYEDVFQDVDLEYEISGYDIKESIVINQPLPGYAFQFRIFLNGLVPELQEDGSILLSDWEGNVLFKIPAPYMMDAVDAYSEDVSYSLVPCSFDEWILTVAADADWIESPERVFPVSIDPTVIDYTGKTGIKGAVCSERHNFTRSDGKVACGNNSDHGQMDLYFTLPKLPTIPKGHTVVNAMAGFQHIDFYSGTDSRTGKIVLYLHKLIDSWSGDNSIIWENHPRHDPTILDYVVADFSTLDDILLWDITPAAKSWYAGEPNYGLYMTSNATASNKCRAWFSFNEKPTCIVLYRNTNGIESYYTYQTAGIGNAGTAYIGDFSGQLTLCKNLISFSSVSNPVAIDLAYNSSYAVDYGSENYDTGGNLEHAMHVGAGVTLSIMKQVREIIVRDDSDVGNYKTYLAYTDGDGTVHYFTRKRNSSDRLFYDEDGLNLKIERTASGTYTMSDDKDNKQFFVNGLLSKLQDANGNEINIQYETSGHSGVTTPYASGSRIKRVVQKNKDGTAITVATFTYSSNSAWLDYIEDYSNAKYKFEYTDNGNLSAIKRITNANNTQKTTTLAQYGYSGTRMTYAYDPEAEYGIAFTYVDQKVASYYEITGTNVSVKPGIIINIGRNSSGETCYRDLRTDQVVSSDDILTYYSFDYAGRTVNAYTTDASGKMLGASNAVYSGTGITNNANNINSTDTTNKTNNRTLRTASIGVAAMNELENYGAESTEQPWSFIGAGQTGISNIVVSQDNHRTGNKALKGWIGNGVLTEISATHLTTILQPNETYTLSAYVNTSECNHFNGSGVYLKISGNNQSAESEHINYKSDSQIDGGWLRLSVTFTAAAHTVYTVGVYNNGADGIFYADDFQLERSDTPSNLNLLENGNMQNWNHGWQWNETTWLSHFAENCGLFSVSHYAYSMCVGGDAYTESYAYQDVPINNVGDTYVLSGWAKANAAPDNLTKATGDNAAAEDKHKQFGLRAIITYADNTTEKHYVPFNPDLTDWQFTSLAIVPKRDDAVIKTIRVVCAYERNVNEAFFDNISLVREVAQTMKYDKDGNLVSVKSTGNSEESSVFENGNLTKLTTGGSGTFTYTYDSKHNVTKATNGVVSESISYDGKGNPTSVELKSENNASLKMKSQTGYTTEGNLVSEVTDSRGNKTHNYYSGRFNTMSGNPSSVKNAKDTEVQFLYNEENRMRLQYINGTVSLNYNYDNGMLHQVVRGGYKPNDATKYNQTYNLAYDEFGNQLSVAVGNRILSTNSYLPHNGPLASVTYGNGASVSYTYDTLDRVTEKTISGGGSYTYSYTGDGQLYQMVDTAENTLYRYSYDTLGRLIGTHQSRGSVDLLAQYGYDDDDRLETFALSIPGVIDNASEKMYYNSDDDSVSDGAIEKMDILSGEELSYTYDGLSRLTQRSVAHALVEHITYTGGVNGNTTTLPKQFFTTKTNSSAKLAGYEYTYDALGNITGMKDLTTNAVTTYEYDVQNQLTSATAAGVTTEYAYDTYGNLLTVKQNDTPIHSYTYGDSEWLDLLTEYDGQSISYDDIGNPTNWYNGQTYTNLTWQNGRELSGLRTGNRNYTFDYDVNGLRTSKTNFDGGQTEYFIVDGLAVAERRYAANGTERYTMRYTFDENNAPIGFDYKTPTGTWQHYYFVKNLQGDVVAMYHWYSATNCALVCTYEYDPWGKLVSVKQSNGNEVASTTYHISNYNPFRYRGYYYDNGTNLYLGYRL